MMKRPLLMPSRRMNIFATGLLLGGIFGSTALGAAEGTNEVSARAPFSKFKMVTDNNIFNTKRSARYVPSSNVVNVRPRRSDYVALVGVMAYEKGPFAFFEGSSSEFQKVLKADESIAGFKIGEIDSSSVKLTTPTNQLELKLGMQLSRQEGGEWQLAARPENLDTGGSRTVATRWTAQPAAPRSETEQQPQGNGPQFNFPQGPMADGILQAIQGNFQGNFQGNSPRGVVIRTQNDQNGDSTIVVPAPGNSGNASEGDVLQRLIRRRQEQNN